MRDRAGGAAEQTEARVSWYGWQIALSDAAAAGLLAWGAAADVDAPIAAGVGVYLLVPPGIHLSRQRHDAAAGSVTLRVLMPGFAYLSGWELVETEETDASRRRLLQRVFASMLVVSVIDIAFLSLQFERKRRESALRPRLWLHREHAVLGAGGAF